jgi:preprotein translocase subunit SecD
MFPAAARLIPWLPATAVAACCCFITGKAAGETPAAGPADVEFTLKVQPRMGEDGNALPLTAQDLERTRQIIARRIKACTPNKAAITIRKPDTISARIPSLSREKGDEISRLLTKAAKLELREVSRRNDEVGADGRTLARRVFDKMEIVPGYRAYLFQQKDVDGNPIQTPILVNRRVALSNKDIARAFPSPLQADAVAIVLNGPGTKKMIGLTAPMKPLRGRIAVVLDGEVINAPVVMSVPLGENFTIESLLTGPGEVQTLASALMYPLENTLELVEMRVISNALKK